MNENNKKINTRNLIALCHIIDYFKEFENKLLPAISSKDNRNFVHQLYDISKGKVKLGAKKAKKFYNENNIVIDIINKYSNISRFINLNYDFHGKPGSDLYYFFEYLLKHKEEISKILVLLEKIKELGFSTIEFNEELDFTKEIYSAYPSFNRNFYLTYVANPQIIPNYLSYINFKTADSNYKMKLGISGWSKKEISEYGREIVLNSLLFEPNTLPAKIDKEHTFDHLLKLKNSQKEKTAVIRNSVDLSISVSDLEHQLNSTDNTINKLDEVTNKEELISVLSNIRENVEKLKTLSSEYDESISQEEPSITQEDLEREKQLYLNRRELAKIDLC